MATPLETIACVTLTGEHAAVTLTEPLAVGGHAEIWAGLFGGQRVVARFLLQHEHDKMPWPERSRRFWDGWDALVEHLEKGLFVAPVAHNRGMDSLHPMMVLERLEGGTAKERAAALYAAGDEAGLLTLLRDCYTQLGRVHRETSLSHGDPSLVNLLAGTRSGAPTWLFIDLDGAHHEDHSITDTGVAGRPYYWKPPALDQRVASGKASIEERRRFDVVCLGTGLVAAVDELGQPRGNEKRRDALFSHMTRLRGVLAEIQGEKLTTAPAVLAALTTGEAPAAEHPPSSDGNTDVGGATGGTNADGNAVLNTGGAAPPGQGTSGPVGTARPRRGHIPVRPARPAEPSREIPVGSPLSQEDPPAWFPPVEALKANPRWFGVGAPAAVIGAALFVGLHLHAAARSEHAVRLLNGSGGANADALGGAGTAEQRAVLESARALMPSTLVDPLGAWTRLAHAEVRLPDCVSHRYPTACEGLAETFDSLLDRPDAAAHFAGRGYALLERHAAACVEHGFPSDPERLGLAVDRWEAGARGVDLLEARRLRAAIAPGGFWPALDILRTAYAEIGNADLAEAARDEWRAALADDAAAASCGADRPTASLTRAGHDTLVARACGFVFLDDATHAEYALSAAGAEPAGAGTCRLAEGSGDAERDLLEALHRPEPRTRLVERCQALIGRRR